MKAGTILNRFTTKDGKEIILRTVQKTELKEVNCIFMEVIGEEKYPLKLLVDKHRSYLSLFINAFYKKQIIGIVFGWPDLSLLIVKAIAVWKDYRRKGIGTALLKAFEENAMREGFENFVLGARWEAVPFYFSYGLHCFGNVQVKPNQIHWQRIKKLREKYEILSAVVFSPTSMDDLVAKLNNEFNITVSSVESKYKSVSIQFKPTNISEAALEKTKKDFNAYAIQFCFRKK
jgi:GNAT superfamily N-acetyltransferase